MKPGDIVRRCSGAGNFDGAAIGDVGVVLSVPNRTQYRVLWLQHGIVSHPPENRVELATDLSDEEHAAVMRYHLKGRPDGTR